MALLGHPQSHWFHPSGSQDDPRRHWAGVNFKIIIYMIVGKPDYTKVGLPI